MYLYFAGLTVTAWKSLPQWWTSLLPLALPSSMKLVGVGSGLTGKHTSPTTTGNYLESESSLTFAFTMITQELSMCGSALAMRRQQSGCSREE